MDGHSPARRTAPRSAVARIARQRVASAADEARLLTRFGRTARSSFAGHVADPADPSRRFVVQLFIDGLAVQVAIADQYDDTLVEDGVGDGCHGFVFSIAADALLDAATVEARLANSGTLIGAPIDLRDATMPAEQPGLRGARWIGGLRFCGWLQDADQGVPKVVALVDGVPVAEVYARTWQQLGSRDNGAQAVPAFDLHLPPRFADGRVRTVRIVDEAGQELPGSPLTFVAFDGGLERALADLGQRDSERLRGELFDRLIPASLPMSRYRDWLTRFPPAAATIDSSDQIAVVFAGQGDEAKSIASLDGQTGWLAAALPGDFAEFDAAGLRGFLSKDAAGADVVIFALCGLQLESHAVATLAAACRGNPQAAAIYADIAVVGGAGEAWPILLPAFDYERMLEQGCGAYLFATRREPLERALAARPANLFGLFQALAGDPVAARDSIMHLPGVLGTLPDIDIAAGAAALAAATAKHLRDRGVAAGVDAQPGATFPAARVRRRPAKGRVSVIIPTRNQAGLLRRCLETVAPALERCDAEIIVVDNDSSDAETLDYLAAIDGLAANVVRVPGVFNFSRLNNAAVAAARGDYLCLMNNDIEALDDRWLEEMLGRIAEPDVGAVGATLLWPSGVIQHAGVVLGPNLGAAHAFTDRMQDDTGYGGLLSVARECSAVTAACLLTRKSDYLAVGGLDEAFFPVNFNDVDYCLKLRALGRRIVLTPHARLLHLESASRGSDQRPDRAGRMQRELRALRARWLEAIVDDPCYSPLLSLDSIPFSALAWPPRSRAARLNRPPQPVAVPSGL